MKITKEQIEAGGMTVMVKTRWGGEASVALRRLSYREVREIVKNTPDAMDVADRVMTASVAPESVGIIDKLTVAAVNEVMMTAMALAGLELASEVSKTIPNPTAN